MALDHLGLLMAIFSVQETCFWDSLTEQKRVFVLNKLLVQILFWRFFIDHCLVCQRLCLFSFFEI